MNDFISLSCPSCGGKLQLADDIQLFVCTHCGTEQMVRREGGIIALIPMVEGIQNIQISTDKTASELAIKRIREDINQLNEKIDVAREAILVLLEDNKADKEIRIILKNNKVEVDGKLVYFTRKDLLIPGIEQIAIDYMEIMDKKGLRFKVDSTRQAFIHAATIQDINHTILSLEAEIETHLSVVNQ